MVFQHLAGPRNVSVDLKYGIYAFVRYTRLSWEKQRLEFCISGWIRMLQFYAQTRACLKSVLGS